MARNNPRLRNASTQTAQNAEATLAVEDWLARKLAQRLPDPVSRELAGDVVRALPPSGSGAPSRVEEAILKQEVWRTLVVLRRTHESSNRAWGHFREILTDLPDHLSGLGLELEGHDALSGHLQGAYLAVRDWPLV